MLKAKHDGRQVGVALKLRPAAGTPQDVLADLRALGQVPTATSAGLGLHRERSAFAIEAFARRHMRMRDELAWRAARGETLSPIASATLCALDGVLDGLEPPLQPLDPEVQNLLLDLLPWT
ncbi:MAG: hypothetical protein ABMB14_03975 [Myxococcota bacterium]